MKDFLKTFSGSMVQTFDDTGKNRREMVRVFPMPELAKHNLEELNKSGAGIFFTPNPCKSGRKEENITSIDWVYVDMDNGTKDKMKAKIKEAPIRPHIIIESKRSFHIYWKVDMMDKKDFDVIIHGLIKFFDGDPAISSINEVLRLPGFNHMKDPKNPFKIKLLYFNITPLTSMDMREAYPYTPPEKPKPKPIEGSELERIKQVPIMDVLASLGVEVNKNKFIVENGEITSASVNVNGNYINRFSGKDGSGSNIDACMTYGKMDLPQAIDYLKKLSGIKDIENIVTPIEEDNDEFKQDKIFTWGTLLADKIITPIKEDTFIVFAGESGSGKTEYTFFMARKNSELGHKVLYISLEMNTQAIVKRVSRSYAGITKEQWRDKSLISDHQKNEFKKKFNEIKDNTRLIPVGMVGDVEPTIDSIKEVINKVKPDLVFIDNFDLIKKPSNLSSHEAENVVSKQLLDLTKGLPMPIILVHHLRKGSDDDLNKPRNINSLRGSGKIVHNADMVVMGFRSPFKEEMTNEERAKFSIIQLKDREFGIGGYYKCYFNKGEFYDSMPLENTYRTALEVFSNRKDLT